MHGTMLPAITPDEDNGPLRLRGGGTDTERQRKERAARARRRAGGKTSDGKHETAPAKNVAKAKAYQAVREKRAPRRKYWGRS